MKMPYRLAACLLLSAAPVWISGANTGNKNFNSGAASSSCPDLNLPLAQNPTSDINEFGRKVIAALVNPGETPNWEDWATKEDIGLLPKETSDGASTTSPRLDHTGHLLSSMKKAVQLSARPGPPTDKRPQLASVLYNCVAAEHIRKIIGTPRSGALIEDFPVGSIVVKAVWAPIGLESAPNIAKDAYLPASIFSPDSGTHPEKVAQVQANDTLGGTFTLDQPFEVKSPPKPKSAWVPVKMAVTTPVCPPNLEKTSQTPCLYTCPPNLQGTPQTPCLYAYSFDKKPSANLLDTGTSCPAKCLVALFGVNMMVKAQPGKDWVWITMWWTGTPHSYGLNGSWNYYEVSISDADRDAHVAGGPVGKPWNIIFNPYLEGISSTGYGRVANCKMCHQYAAAVDPKKIPSAQIIQTSAQSIKDGTRLGSGPLPKGSSAATSPKAVVKYKEGKCLTDSMWSLAAPLP